MRKMMVAVLAACAVLAGCASSPGARLNAIQDAAYASVRVQAKSVSDALASGVSDGAAVEAAKAAAAYDLKDPGSAQFRNVSLRAFAGMTIVCGEINAKNSYGGYGGFSRFVAGIYSATIEATHETDRALAHAANVGIYEACGLR